MSKAPLMPMATAVYAAHLDLQTDSRFLQTGS